MQQVVYKCDKCSKEIGKKKHISLVLNTGHDGCGIAIPPKKGGYWKTTTFPSQFIHFCNSVCMQRYFSNLYNQE